jgi:hypothetical protein
MVVTVKKTKIPDLEKAYREAARKNVNVSRDWLVSNYNVLRKMGPIGILGFAKHKQAKLQPGQLAFFWYDAKYKDEMPFWDTFPLALYIDRTPTGFLGLNLHYIPPRRRYALLEALMDFQNNDTLNDQTRILASYKYLKGVSKYSDFKPCLHQYRWDHAKSSFAIVPPTSWHLALGLPVYSTFVQGGLGKDPDSKVWTRKVWGNTGR